MIITVGLMFAVYLGVRYTEKRGKEGRRRTMNGKIRQASAHAQQVEERQDETLIIPNQQVEEEIPSEEKLAELIHYKITSLASMGLFALTRLWPPLGVLGLGFYIYSAIPYMRDVEKSLTKDHKINVDVLFFIGDSLTLGSRKYFTAAIGLYLMHWGKHSVALAKNDSKTKLSGLFENLPQKVWVQIGEEEMEIPLTDVKKNHLVIVDSGGVVPVDGTIIEGMASIDQHPLTGEAQPVEKEVGAPVFAHTMVITGRILIRVEKSGDETAAFQIGNALLHATEFKTGVQLKGEKWADMATLPMLAGAAIMLPTMGPVPTIVFINSHIGNRIRVLAPMSTMTHISHALSHGILVKDGRVLENLHKIDTILFDKTGTLTMEEPEVGKVIALASFNETDVLAHAATAEQRQNHPIARAIMKKAQDAGVQPSQHQDSEYRIGYGIIVFRKGIVIRVGSMRFLEEEGIIIPETVLQHQEWAYEQGYTLVLVSMDDQVAGCIVLQPTVRPEVRDVIARLRQQGIKHLAIVSGDHREPTRQLAESLGMDDFFHDVLPQDKADIVTALQGQGRSVGFMGDGINDTIAMKKANASISLRGATTIAMDMAEIVLMDGDLNSLNELLELSEKLRRNLNRALMFTLAPGVINLGGAFIFHFSILTSMMVNLVLGSFAAWNARRVGKLPEPKKKTTQDQIPHVQLTVNPAPAELEVCACNPFAENGTSMLTLRPFFFRVPKILT
ncbi:MAG: hypothetical protein ETSY1_46540 (plasmid) [Candidatus Entotheonella factor]|uniref:P-type Zn(2+) transporter n=1 Tax=Entotheonella factor TaxID=1429438 RepID=W4M0J4_ENTF1|nr:MAG: hypothetical protein ETSY1_46540 [Candidatus Entotheonella factor]